MFVMLIICVDVRSPTNVRLSTLFLFGLEKEPLFGLSISFAVGTSSMNVRWVSVRKVFINNYFEKVHAAIGEI